MHAKYITERKAMDRIINSLLENDAYKFSMGQAIYHQLSDYKTTWTFKCRNTDVFFTKEMARSEAPRLKEPVHLCKH